MEAIFIGKARQYNRRFPQMCSHHLIEPVACPPWPAHGDLQRGHFWTQNGGHGSKRFDTTIFILGVLPTNTPRARFKKSLSKVLCEPRRQFSQMRSPKKVVLAKWANRECIASNAEFRPQRTSLPMEMIQPA